MSLSRPSQLKLDRRRFLKHGFASAGMITVGTSMATGFNAATGSLLRQLDTHTQRTAFLGALRGGLNPPDGNGVRLPAGFVSRIVARSSQPVPNTRGGTPYTWHSAPDGGATYPTQDGGWIYVSNAELGPPNGGVGALVFDAQGNVVDGYRILDGTNRNCAGGPTPWNTWLSCEEHDQGLTWECDPYGVKSAVALPALGTFSHEAAAVDPVRKHVYQTEDEGDSGFYKFVPTKYPDLSAGVLQIAQVLGDPLTGRRRVIWHSVPNPNPGPAETPTRHQVPGIYAFNRGEGMWYHDGIVYFATTGDDRVWAYRVVDESIEVLYDAKTAASSPLHEPDNVLVDRGGFVYVAEDSDDLQIVLLTPEGEAMPFVQLVGHDSSEICGPAFSPDGTRMYFSSQRGTTGSSGDGIVFEVTGPFLGTETVFRDGFEPRVDD